MAATPKSAHGETTAFAGLASRDVHVIGAAFCEGQNLAGADAAPAALRAAGLAPALAKLGWTVHDPGDLDFDARYRERGLGASLPLDKHHESMERYREWEDSGMAVNFATWAHDHGAQHGSGADGDAAVGESSARAPPQIVNGPLIGCGLELVHEAVARAAALGRFALTLGGDHSVAAGSVSALCEAYPRLGVIWIDAHADANTPSTSPSLHYHGMPAAHLLGWFERQPAGFDWLRPGVLPESSLAYIGLRDIDPDEAKLLRASKAHVYTMRDVDKHGIGRVVEMALEAVDPHRNGPLHLSLDVDAVDPHFAPGTGTMVRGGLTYREIHYIAEEMALTGRLVGMDLVEVNPHLEPSQAGGGAARAMHNEDPEAAHVSPTVNLGVELILSALGKTIMHDRYH